MDLTNITVNKQSSIRIAGSSVLYFDPFELSEKAQDADMIFITHEHYDHFQPESICKIVNKKTILIAPATMQEIIEKADLVERENCRFLEPGNILKEGKITIEAVPAYNKMKPFHPKSKKWNGYVVTLDGKGYYIAGDTDVNEDIKRIKCDVALIPIGGGFTMDKKQAAEYILGLKPAAVIPTHYGEVVGKITDGRDFKELVEAKDNQIQVALMLSEG